MQVHTLVQHTDWGRSAHFYFSSTLNSNERDETAASKTELDPHREIGLTPATCITIIPIIEPSPQVVNDRKTYEFHNVHLVLFQYDSVDMGDGETAVDCSLKQRSHDRPYHSNHIKRETYSCRGLQLRLLLPCRYWPNCPSSVMLRQPQGSGISTKLPPIVNGSPTRTNLGLRHEFIRLIVLTNLQALILGVDCVLHFRLLPDLKQPQFLEKTTACALSGELQGEPA